MRGALRRFDSGPGCREKTLLLLVIAACSSTTVRPAPPPTWMPPGPVGRWVNVTPPGVSLSQSDFGGNNYGMQTIGTGPAFGTLYLGTCYQGIWKSTDSGDHWIKINTGANSHSLDNGRNWTLAVDPTNANVVYTAAGFGDDQGLWKSTDGGTDWEQLLPAAVMLRTTSDVYCVAIDPQDHLHLLVGFHSGWSGGKDAGLVESTDGGRSWLEHPPLPGWGAGHYVFFLTSSTWILATQVDGFWRTGDSGKTWLKVSSFNMQHGADQLYRAANGVLYLGASGHLIRSVDDGLTWLDAGAPSNQDGYHAIIGDGTYLYAQSANTGGSTVGSQTYFYSPESDGTTWKPYNDQTFADGPMSMATDQEHGIVYSSNWRGGVWRLVTRH
jgi:photosystem II stability/assembly factor-like uncharacterized protein